MSSSIESRLYDRMDWDSTDVYLGSKYPPVPIAGRKRTFRDFSETHDQFAELQPSSIITRYTLILARSAWAVASRILHSLNVQPRGLAIEYRDHKRRIINMPGTWPQSHLTSPRSAEHLGVPRSSDVPSRRRSASQSDSQRSATEQPKHEQYPNHATTVRTPREIDKHSKSAIDGLVQNFLRQTQRAEPNSKTLNDQPNPPKSAIKPLWRADRLRRLRGTQESKRDSIASASILPETKASHASRPHRPPSPPARDKTSSKDTGPPLPPRLTGRPYAATIEAVNQDLSFLPDALPPRHVKFEHSAWLGAPFPRVRNYAPGEKIGHPVFPYDKKSFTELRDPSPASSIMQATPVAPRLPHWQSPEAPGTSTDVAGLERDLGLFEISQQVKQSRRQKEEGRRREEQEAKAREEAARRKALAGVSVVNRLTRDWEEKVDEAMAAKRPNQTYSNTTVNRHDLGTLLPQTPSEGVGWLNDEIVNEYLAALVARAVATSDQKPGIAPPLHAFSTHLYNTWKAKGFAGVARWFKRAKMEGSKLLAVGTIFVPINESSHWTLLIVSGTRQTVEYYDSLGGRGAKYADFALDLVRGNLGEKAFKREEWRVLHTDSARQTNGMDCGVFVCMNALALVLGREPRLAVPSAEMPLARRQVAATLLNGGFTGDFEFGAEAGRAISSA